MGFFSKFERRVEDGFDEMGDKFFDAPISPVQIAKKAEKQMRREKMVGAGKEYAPTLYTVLVNPDDDERLFGYYPTLAGETETYLRGKAQELGLVMDGSPLVRFIIDDELKHGKFDVVAELVSAPIVSQLRAEEMQQQSMAFPPRKPALPSPQTSSRALSMASSKYTHPSPTHLRRKLRRRHRTTCKHRHRCDGGSRPCHGKRRRRLRSRSAGSGTRFPCSRNCRTANRPLR